MAMYPVAKRILHIWRLLADISGPCAGTRNFWAGEIPQGGDLRDKHRCTAVAWTLLSPAG
jgi:hypothetical protein